MRSPAFAAVVVAAALTAGPAAAKDFCVGPDAGCSPSVQGALDAANANPGHDRVLVGAGVWTDVVAGGDVEVDGSGPATAFGGLRVAAGDGATTVRRVRIAGTVAAESGTLSIRDALIDARAGSGPGLTAASGSVDLTSVTLLGAGQQAIDAHAPEPADHVSVSLRDSVVSGFGAQALSRSGAGVANMSLDYVDVFPGSDVVQHAAGTLTENAVTHADPRLGADGITPMAGSPLIDAATPGAFGGGELDLLGNPRLRASGCGTARRDIGAVEAVGTCRPRHHRWLGLRWKR
jgi:hypothetical protein